MSTQANTGKSPARFTEGHCQCGHARFSMQGQPLMRAFCHCSICQQFNDAPFSDITLFRRRDVIMPEATSVAYRNYMSPAMVYRGTCVQCEKPTVEYIHSALMPALVIVPSANISDQSFVPAPALHIFYDTRVADIDDSLPKHEGFLRSQGAFSWHLLRAFLKR